MEFLKNLKKKKMKKNAAGSTQAFFYLKLYSKILEGSISIDKIKELGFKNIKKTYF
ncbi:conserved hypothetical protein (plasmid) [Borreliella garinii PBr]|uniref:Plasmid partition protein n=1 Tax=Borreliella garinii PBr TaxID=498743 RepID=B8F193_BORGR|nr:conserved hypothetical protein [Borreliella garinii PBr]